MTAVVLIGGAIIAFGWGARWLFGRWGDLVVVGVPAIIFARWYYVKIWSVDNTVVTLTPQQTDGGVRHTKVTAPSDPAHSVESEANDSTRRTEAPK